MGRPKTIKESKKCSFDIPRTLKDALADEAWRSRVPFATLIRAILERHTSKKKKRGVS
jgi:hypothetical protein